MNFVLGKEQALRCSNLVGFIICICTCLEMGFSRPTSGQTDSRENSAKLLTADLAGTSAIRRSGNGTCNSVVKLAEHQEFILIAPVFDTAAIPLNLTLPRHACGATGDSALSGLRR